MLNGFGLRRWAWSGRDSLDMSELVAAQLRAAGWGSLVLRNPPQNDQPFLGRLLGLGELFIAPFDMILSPTNVVQPDLIFISSARAHIITEDNIRGAPDLIVEILSPSTAGCDRTTKRNLYARHAVREYWLIDPYAKTATVLILGANGYDTYAVYGEGDTLTSPTLAGFSMNMGDLF